MPSLSLQPTVECVDKDAVKDIDTVKVELSSETSCVSIDMFYCCYEIHPYGLFTCPISLCGVPHDQVSSVTVQYSLSH